MDVMQKFRDRFRRSSSDDVTSICIAALPSDSRQSFGVVRRYSTAEGAFQPKAKPRNEKSVGHSQITVESLVAIRKEETTALESKHKIILQENDKLQNEKEDLAAKLQNSFEKILERDETIQKLHVAMEQMKQERLQDEEVRYHRSILAKRQYTIDLENELEKMKGQIKKMEKEMFLYGGLMAVISIIFAVMASFYTYLDFSGIEEKEHVADDKMILEEKGMTPAASTTTL